MTESADAVIAACEAEWDSWKADCSGFVKAVASRLEIGLTGKANALVDALGNAPLWENLGEDPKAASQKADLGYFVVGGLKSQPNGHVVIVVSGPPQQYPVGYWGQLGRVGRKKTTLNWSWNAADLTKVQYFAFAL